MKKKSIEATKKKNMPQIAPYRTLKTEKKSPPLQSI